MQELLNAGKYDSFFVPLEFNEKTVEEALREIAAKENVEINIPWSEFFGVLVNGKKAEPNDLVFEGDRIVVVPHVAGG